MTAIQSGEGPARGSTFKAVAVGLVLGDAKMAAVVSFPGGRKQPKNWLFHFCDRPVTSPVEAVRGAIVAESRDAS
jgi:hypothetical protein